MRSIKEKKGITLIALAVTIVVILILAGVTIDVTLGENGILNKSKEAADRMNNLVKEDEAELNILLNELNETMDSNWSGNIDIPDPEPEKPTKVEDVTDIQEETVQVEDEYGNKITIPKGFEVVEEEGTTVPEGIVVQDKDSNQFVWIPVGRVYKDNTGTNYSDIQLGRYTFNTNNGEPTLVQAAYTEANSKNYAQIIKISDNFQAGCYEYATRENPDGIAANNGTNAIAKNLGGFVDSVKKNRGYYLARYEASYGSGNSVINYKALSQVSTGTIRTNWSTPFSKGMLWNVITQIDAAKISRNTYDEGDNVGVESDLINSYAWDTAIVFIQEMGNENYANKTSINTVITNTGTTGDEVCNINDLASNCFEWTTEYCDRIQPNSTYYHSCTIRGGFQYAGIFHTATRLSYDPTRADNVFGFRILLYIK